jgi:uncharacterized protein (TIGR00369 family)
MKEADEAFEARVRASFARQNAMRTLGITISSLEPGRVEFRMPFSEAFTQQHGFMHAGAVTLAIDTACGYAAFSMMPRDAAVLTVEFKANFLAPAKGDAFRIVGQVVKAGRTLTVCAGEAFAISGATEVLIATMSATMMAVTGRQGIEH